MEEEEIETLSQQETIKLFKNSRGINWETKVLKNKDETEEAFRLRLKDRFDYLQMEYTGGAE